MTSRALLLLWATGAIAGIVFLLDWAGYQGKFAPLTTRYLADIWWHFPAFWLIFWVAFVALDRLSDRLSRFFPRG